MNKACVKEYNYLKSEIKDIKNWIDKYIGYVIGVSGISAILAKYLITPNNTEQLTKSDIGVQFAPFTSILVLVALVIITFLFDILWYKFISHNKIAGYMELLSQETDLFRINDNIKNDTNKTYLKKAKISKKAKLKEDLITWEFVMSRLNDISSNKREDQKITNSTANSFYSFKLANKYSPEKLGDDFKELDTQFYNKCIIPQYKHRNSPLQAIKNIFDIFFNYKMNNRNCKIDSKYLPYGWKYPIKLIQLAIISVIGLSFSFFYCLNHFYKFSISGFNENMSLFISLDFISLSSKILNNYLNIGTLLVFIWSIVILRWLVKYIGQSHELMNGKLSIEYYCWQFLIFRVQYLNSKNILPRYYSRNFIRYYKSYSIVKYLETRDDYNDDHIQNYKTTLESCGKFSEQNHKTHLNIIEQAKKYCEYDYSKDYQISGKLKAR